MAEKKVVIHKHQRSASPFWRGIAWFFGAMLALGMIVALAVIIIPAAIGVGVGYYTTRTSPGNRIRGMFIGGSVGLVIGMIVFAATGSSGDDEPVAAAAAVTSTTIVPVTTTTQPPATTTTEPPATTTTQPLPTTTIATTTTTEAPKPTTTTTRAPRPTTTTTTRAPEPVDWLPAFEECYSWGEGACSSFPGIVGAWVSNDLMIIDANADVALQACNDAKGFLAFPGLIYVYDAVNGDVIASSFSEIGGCALE